ncbi:CoA transferase [Streptomyces sp. bgisy027]|uniref:CoA transferase n=1 Tax=unclassified Streptomyces TaxID=2593676 RepID=UPI003D70A91E
MPDKRRVEDTFAGSVADRGPLWGLRVAARGNDPGARYAAWLLGCLGARRVRSDRADFVIEPGDDAAHPFDDWASSGAMALTGRSDGPPLPAPGGPATAVRGGLLAIQALAARMGRSPVLPDFRLLGERAATAGFTRRGPYAPGGTFQLLRALGGRWIGVNLARQDDLDLVPALTERQVGEGAHWEAVTAWAASRPADACAERGELLGIPVSVLGTPGATDAQLAARAQRGRVRPFLLNSAGEAQALTGCERPLVVDLSALWAGPLCAQLLGLTGARVVKVESTTRPDGARRGPRAFYDLLHEGHEAVALDFADPADLGVLRALIYRAHVIVESSRPRAMAQLGIDPYAILARTPGLTWVSITAYGRTGPWSGRVGFGDDVAVAAGLVARDEIGALPCGDAIADPLAGVHAAVAALACIGAGGGRLVDVAMRESAAAAVALHFDNVPARAGHPVLPPVARVPSVRAAAHGEHSQAVIESLGLRPGRPGSRSRAVRAGAPPAGSSSRKPQ